MEVELDGFCTDREILKCFHEENGQGILDNFILLLKVRFLGTWLNRREVNGAGRIQRKK